MNAESRRHSTFLSHLVFVRSVRRLLVTAYVVPSSPIRVTLMKDALSSSETSVLTRATRRNISEDTILHSHGHENLKSYNILHSHRRENLKSYEVYQYFSTVISYNCSLFHYFNPPFFLVQLHFSFFMFFSLSFIT
jgi:hypothetical protein